MPTLKRFSIGLLAAVAAALLVLPGAAGAQNYRQLGIYPVFDGWETLPDGSLKFYFGYMNRHTTQITIPLGPDNVFDPAPADQNQPTNFLPGRHEHMFTVVRPKGFNAKFVWTLKSGVGAQKAIASPDQLYILEVEEEDPGEHVVPPQIAATDGSGKAGRPMTLTPQVKATAQKERVIEGSGPRNAGLSVAWHLHRGPAAVTFAAVPGAPAPRAPGGRGGRPEPPPAPGLFTTTCAFPLAAACGAVQTTFSAPGDYVLSVVAQQQRERARTFVRVHVEP
jgi:hypothetical protein